MKSLYTKLCSSRCLKRAWETLTKSPQSHGISNETIQTFRDNLTSNLKQIQKELKSNSYQFSPLRAVPIHKEKNKVKKIRPIRIAEIRDRVVLKAIANLITPQLQKQYKLKNPASFAYQKRIGTRHAIERMVRLFHDGNKVALEGDIIKFFDRVDRKYLLYDLIYPILPDDTLNNLIDQGLEIEIGNAEELTDEEKLEFDRSEGGIPQGSALSPLLSNVYLSKFDQGMLNAGYGLVRYADDFLVMCPTENEAIEAYKLAKLILEDELHLNIHALDNESKDSKCRIVRPSQKPLEFLSIMFNGQRLYPAPRKITELKDKIQHNVNQYNQLTVIEVLTKTKNILEGWLAAFHYTDLEPNIKIIDDFINTHIGYVLRDLGWKLKDMENKKGKWHFTDTLSELQRNSSGIPFCRDILKKYEDSKIKVAK